HGDEKVQAVSLEEIVRPHRQENVEVALGPAAKACIALAGEADPRAVVDARWNGDRKGALSPNLAVALAGAAGVQHQPPRAIAARAGAFDGEEALRRPHAADAVAGRTGHRRGARLGARALAALTVEGRGDGDLDLGAGIGLGEVDLEVVAKILAG